MRAAGGSDNLWHYRDFLKLWAGESISLVGSQVTTLALPLTAVLTLGASGFEVALLTAATWAPYLLVTLLAGVWVDRLRRLPLLIGANAGRALLLATIPLAHLLGALRLELLLVVAFLTGALTVVFNLSYRSYLPTLVGREHLLEGNSKLQTSASVAEIGGPGLGGLLVNLLTAPLALLVDAASFLVSAVCLATIRGREPEPVPADERRGVRREIAEGLRLTYRNPYLRSIAGSAATYNLFEGMMLALLVVFATRQLDLGPGTLGVVMSIGSLGALAGAVSARRLADRIGLGPALIVTVAVECVALLLIPVAGGGALIASAMLALAFTLNGYGLAASNIYCASVRQAMVPHELLGRATASYSTLTLGVVPVGALLAGGLQAVVGLRLTLLVGALGALLTVGWIVGPHIRQLHALPAPPNIVPSSPEPVPLTTA